MTALIWSTICNGRSEIEIIEYSEDRNSLNVYHDSRACHNVEVEDINDMPRLVVTRIKRDPHCDKN